MVLVMLGMQGWLLLSAKSAGSENESYMLTLYFRDTVGTARIMEMKKQIAGMQEVKSVEYTDREKAAALFKEELGEDFVDFLGYNPMPASLSVIFRPEFADENLFKDFDKRWSGNPNVEKVDYPRNLMLAMATNMKRLGWILLGIGFLMAIIAITLINNTIRLVIYSRRFHIKTMLLVGATQRFIRRPFVLSGIWQGLAGGGVAIIVLASLLWFGEKQIPGLQEMRNPEMLGMLAGGLLVAGVLLSVICTYFAVRKYLNIKADLLY
jgi:cell division transport system permease protein